MPWNAKWPGQEDLVCMSFWPLFLPGPKNELIELIHLGWLGWLGSWSRAAWNPIWKSWGNCFAGTRTWLPPQFTHGCWFSDFRCCFCFSNWCISVFQCVSPVFGDVLHRCVAQMCCNMIFHVTAVTSRRKRGHVGLHCSTWQVGSAQEDRKDLKGEVHIMF